jgi:hypothetical protein
MSDPSGPFPTKNDMTKFAIKELEAKSLRAMREHILGDPSALARIQDTDTQIAALRAQLTPE